MSKWCNYQPSHLPDAKEVFSWPCSALGGPECRSVPQEPCLEPTKGEQTLLQPYKPWSHHTWQNTWPQTTSREFHSQWKYTWCSWMLTVHPAAPSFACSTALAWGLMATSLQSIKLLRKCQKKTAQWPHFPILTGKWKETLIVCLCHLLPQLTDVEYSLRWH